MGWFSKKIYPAIWQEYLNYFQQKKRDFPEVRFVIFDTETTGLDVNEDRVLSIGAIGIQHQKIVLQDTYECFVQQDKFSRDTVEIHGIRKTGQDKIIEKEAVHQFLKYVKNAVLVGHHIDFDIAMINIALKRMELPKLKNTLLDTGNLHLKTLKDMPQKSHFSLDALAEIYHIPLHDRHTSSGDAFITAQIYLKILKTLEKNNPLSISYLKRPAKRIGLI